jgi:hypothetical protein
METPYSSQGLRAGFACRCPRILPVKNNLTETDAELLEESFEQKLSGLSSAGVAESSMTRERHFLNLRAATRIYPPSGQRCPRLLTSRHQLFYALMHEDDADHR